MSFISVVGDIIHLFCWMDYGHYFSCVRACDCGDFLLMILYCCQRFYCRVDTS